MGKLNAAAAQFGGAATRLRAWLRVAMPRVALIAAGLLVVSVIFSVSPLDETRLDDFLEALTFFVVCATLFYFGVKALRWMKRRLLWRVRRRLIITYLFVGLTPVVLLGLLAVLSFFIFAGQALSRIVSVQVDTTEKQTLASARSLADSFSALPATADERSIQKWLDDNASVLQGPLPGVRIALWRSGAGQTGSEVAANTGQGKPADFVSASSGAEELRGVGDDLTPVGAPLPEWLAGQAEWNGFAFFVPADSSRASFGTPSVRALVRRETSGRGFALLLVVPVSRALVNRYRETTGLEIKPFFVGTGDILVSNDGDSIVVRRDDGPDPNPDPDGQPTEGNRQKEMDTRDQFGQPVSVAGSYIVLLDATDWVSGASDSHLSFVFNFSWFDSIRQLMSGTTVGEVLQTVLLYLALTFLVFELIALGAAAFMTRAVTGTVHRLYRATEFIKQGDFSHRVSVRSHDQLGELAVAFNDMSANIESLLEERVMHERLEREVEIAAEVQAQLFPRSVPLLSNAEITGECRAARGVAGDYYDYLEVEPGLVIFALGDVSGKGISASLVMSNLQASLRAQVVIIQERRRLAERGSVATVTTAGAVADSADAPAPRGDTDGAVESMAASINRQLCSSTEANRFATLFLALYDERTRTLRYTNAGHNTPVLARADGRIERLDVGGTIVGSFDFAVYEEAQVALDAGDTLVVFSDGLSEAQNATGEEFGEDRLAQLTASNRNLSAGELRRVIFEEVDRWSGESERGDDQTLVILKAVKSDK